MISIGPSVHIVGEVRSDDDLFIEGCIEGRIHVGQATLTIGPLWVSNSQFSRCIQA